MLAISYLGGFVVFEDEELEMETQAAADRRRPASPPPFVRTRKPAPGRKPYTPQFSELAVVSVRRLAWSLGVSMPKAVDQAVSLLPSLFAPGVVCPSCKDNTKCKSCAFSRQPAAAPAAPAV
jgi:hypothetical protein